MILGSYAPSLLNFRGPLIAALVAKQYAVVAAAPDVDPPTARALRSLGAEPVSVDVRNTSLSPFGMLRSNKALRRVLREHRPDVLLSYTIKPVILGAFAGRSQKVSKIVSLITGLGFAFTGSGGSATRRLARLAAARLYRLALRRSDIVLFQNKDDRALLRDLGILSPRTASAVVDGSGVDIDHFAVASLPSATSFLMIARLLNDKGIREYAEAAKRVRAEHPEVAIGLVGYLDPSPDSLTQAELDQLIAAGIHFYGKLEDVRPAIAACSVYVLPSYREGTPRSVLEAMALGRAIITTDAPGCRETVVEGVNGFLVPVRDSDALYRAMERFVDDPSLAARLGAESRRLVERRYDARKVSADILRHMGL